MKRSEMTSPALLALATDPPPILVREGNDTRAAEVGQIVAHNPRSEAPHKTMGLEISA
jgi:hypothetical protein